MSLIIYVLLFQGYKELTGTWWSMAYFVSFYLITILLLLNLVSYKNVTTIFHLYFITCMHANISCMHEFSCNSYIDASNVRLRFHIGWNNPLLNKFFYEHYKIATRELEALLQFHSLSKEHKLFPTMIGEKGCYHLTQTRIWTEHTELDDEI